MRFSLGIRLHNCAGKFGLGDFSRGDGVCCTSNIAAVDSMACTVACTKACTMACIMARTETSASSRDTTCSVGAETLSVLSRKNATGCVAGRAKSATSSVASSGVAGQTAASGVACGGVSGQTAASGVASGTMLTSAAVASSSCGVSSCAVLIRVNTRVKLVGNTAVVRPCGIAAVA